MSWLQGCTSGGACNRGGTSCTGRSARSVIIGAFVGHFYPKFGVELKPLGDGFIKLVKMLIAPIVFSTVVTGIAKMGDLKVSAERLQSSSATSRRRS